MAKGDNDARKRAWRNYWASGSLHSCADAMGRNYDGAIGEFWKRRFSGLERGRRLIDLATGNGALPQLLYSMLGSDCEVDAIDQAELAPAWYRPDEHSRIRFHSSVSIESLPFAEATFDGVLSQFGFEYANREKAIQETLRVAGPAAFVALVMHHVDSVLVRVGREELRHHELLGTDRGLLRAATDVAPWIARIKAGERPTPAADASRKRYNNALENLAEAASRSFAPDLLLDARANVHRLLARVGSDPSPVLTDLNGYADMLGHARLRTTEMIACALAESDIGSLASAISAHWPDKPVRVSVLRQPEGVLAWALEAGDQVIGPI